MKAFTENRAVIFRNVLIALLFVDMSFSQSLEEEDYPLETVRKSGSRRVQVEKQPLFFPQRPSSLLLPGAGGFGGGFGGLSGAYHGFGGGCPCGGFSGSLLGFGRIGYPGVGYPGAGFGGYPFGLGLGYLTRSDRLIGKDGVPASLKELRDHIQQNRKLSENSPIGIGSSARRGQRRRGTG